VRVWSKLLQHVWRRNGSVQAGCGRLLAVATLVAVVITQADSGR
jgi:hypothetical protein